MQKPLPPVCGFCDQVAGSESEHEYVPLITTGLFVVLTMTVQFTFRAPPWPALPTALNGPTVLVPVRPIVPGAFPSPLFQWYVTIDARQYVLPFVLKPGGLPPFRTPPALLSSNSLTKPPVQMAVEDR